MKIEPHPFGFFAPENSTTLILGSFPCYNGIDYGDWFYSGSGKNDFWALLSDVFGLPVTTLEQKQELCKKNCISITDVVYSIQRLNGDCKDTNLKIIEYNTNGIKQCIKPSLKRILFTSKFVEKHFNMMFPDIVIDRFVLPSPSARVYIASLDEYKALKNENKVSNTYDYKLIVYNRLLLG